MFDLEEAIAKWREDMRGAGMTRPEVLDELEGHLREDYQRRLRDGAEERLAFDAAIQKIGRPAALQKEFDKIAVFNWFTFASDAFLSFAGIPKRRLVSGVNDAADQSGPGWAAYVRAIFFIAPTLAAWCLAEIFVVPQVNAIWRKDLVMTLGANTSFDHVRHLDHAISSLISTNFLWIVAVVALCLGLMEWRVKFWPRYRRVFLGCTVFTLNVAFLVSLFIQFLAAALAASWLVHLTK
ncbi:MAG TPA: hypothetical protein VFB72_01660 [Verrucomicrobiae bacterium]|nr:hypothetical protein [Verrucomicrobiae bacterium]